MANDGDDAVMEDVSPVVGERAANNDNADEVAVAEDVNAADTTHDLDVSGGDAGGRDTGNDGDVDDAAPACATATATAVVDFGVAVEDDAPDAIGIVDDSPAMDATNDVVNDDDDDDDDDVHGNSAFARKAADDNDKMKEITDVEDEKGDEKGKEDEKGDEKKDGKGDEKGDENIFSESSEEFRGENTKHVESETVKATDGSHNSDETKGYGASQGGISEEKQDAAAATADTMTMGVVPPIETTAATAAADSDDEAEDEEDPATRSARLASQSLNRSALLSTLEHNYASLQKERDDLRAQVTQKSVEWTSLQNELDKLRNQLHKQKQEN